MAKRAPANETPYSPLDADLARSVMEGVEASPEGNLSTVKSSVVRTVGKTGRSGPRSVEPEDIVAHRSEADAPAPGGRRASNRLSREKRVMLSPEEEREVERLVDRIAEDLGTSLKLSHVLRACMSLLCHAEQELHKAAAALAPLTRPANGDAIALAQFEFELTKLLSKALRDALPLR